MSYENDNSRSNREEPLADRDKTQADDSAIARFATDLAGVLMTPSAALRDIGQRGAVAPALALVMLVVLLNTAVQAAMLVLELSPTTAPALFGTGVALSLQLMGLLVNLILAPVLWVVSAGILWGLAKLLGGEGTFKSVLAPIGFAYLPQLLTIPVLAGSELAGVVGGGLQLLTLLVTIPVVIGALVWSLVLMVIAIRENMALTTGRATGVLGLFFLVAMLIGFLIACILILMSLLIFGALAA